MSRAAPETMRGPFSRNTLTAAPPKRSAALKYPLELDAKARGDVGLENEPSLEQKGKES